MRFKQFLEENKKGMEFWRVGGLSAVKQSKNAKQSSFHASPEKSGLYAFPAGYYEPFLVMWSKRNKAEMEKGQGIRKFHYNGQIWAHFDAGTKTIDSKGSWYRMEMEDYMRALKRHLHGARKSLSKMTGDIWQPDKNKGPGIKDPYKRGLSTITTYSKDDMEVFIPKKGAAHVK